MLAKVEHDWGTTSLYKRQNVVNAKKTEICLDLAVDRFYGETFSIMIVSTPLYEQYRRLNGCYEFLISIVFRNPDSVI